MILVAFLIHDGQSGLKLRDRGSLMARDTKCMKFETWRCLYCVLSIESDKINIV